MAKNKTDSTRTINKKKAIEFDAKIDAVIEDGFNKIYGADPRLSNAIQRQSELKVKIYQWRCSVLWPERYKQNIQVSGDPDNPIKTITEIKVTCVSS